MARSELRATILRCMAEYAPADQLAVAADDTPLTELGLDSMTLFHFIMRLEEILEIKIPDTEFAAANFRNLQRVVTALSRVMDRRAP